MSLAPCCGAKSNFTDSPLHVHQAVFEGLAQDGGLLVPHFIPDVSEKYTSWKNMSFDELAFEIATLYVGDEVPPSLIKAY